MKKTTKKPQELAAKTASISMPEFLLEAAKKRLLERGYSGFSDYMKDLVRRDLSLQTAA